MDALRPVWPSAQALAITALLATACGGSPAEHSRESPVTSPVTDRGGAPVGGGAAEGSPHAQSESVWFEEVAQASGVDFQHGFGTTRLWMPEVAGAGAALFDMDGDGDLDLYALQGCDLHPEDAGDRPPFDARNRLFKNLGDGTFEDVTDTAGVGHTGFGVGCAVGDYDGDGHLDLYVTNLRANALFRNLGDGTFEDVTAASGVECPVWSTSAGFVDYDQDGHLDLFVVNYLVWEESDEIACKNGRGTPTYCDPNRYQASEQDRLYRNLGDGTFEDVSARVGLDKAFGNGLGLVWGELDDRPGVDVYVANDGTANQLWSLQPGGAFEDRARALGCALSGNGVAEAGMGVCMEDLNRDGGWDMLVTHLAGETNTFYMSGRRGYRDRTTSSGTMGASLASTGFGVGLVDFDHDGWLDMYVANGRVTHPGVAGDPVTELAEWDQLYRGQSGGRFEVLATSAIQANAARSVSRGAAFGDIDNDGDIDVVLNDYGGPMRILRNVAPKAGPSVTLTVLEEDGRTALGAVVRRRDGSTSIQRQVQAAYSYCASNDPRLHFGLGGAPSTGVLEVTWLDGTRETFPAVKAGAAELRRGRGSD